MSYDTKTFSCWWKFVSLGKLPYFIEHEKWKTKAWKMENKTASFLESKLTPRNPTSDMLVKIAIKTFLVTFGYDIKENDRSISSKLFLQQGNLTNFPFIWVNASMICLLEKFPSRNAKSVGTVRQHLQIARIWNKSQLDFVLIKNDASVGKWKKMWYFKITDIYLKIA